MSSSSFRYDHSCSTVYLLKHTVTEEIYVGFTQNMVRRLAEHNARENKSTNRTVGEWKLLYAEIYKSAKDARSRERKLKAHGSGKHELLKRLTYSLR